MEGKWTKEAQGPLGPCPTRVRMEKYAPAMAEALHRLVTEAELDGTEAKAGWDCWIAEARALLTAIKGE